MTTTTRKSKRYEVLNPGCIRTRTGDKALLTLYLKGADANPHVPVELIKNAGYAVVWRDGVHWIEGLACSNCGSREITAMDAPACRLTKGHYGPGYDNPNGVTCEACRKWTVRPGQLSEHLYPDPKERLEIFKRDHGGAASQERRWTLARYGNSVAIRTQAEDAIGAALPAELNKLEVELY